MIYSTATVPVNPAGETTNILGTLYLTPERAIEPLPLALRRFKPPPACATPIRWRPFPQLKQIPAPV